MEEGFKIESFGTAKLPLDISRQGVVSQPKLLAQMITQLRASSKPKKITTNFCFVNLPDELVFSKFLKLPRVKEEEIEPAIYFKIKDFLPHLPDEMYLDWQIREDGNEEIEANVVAVKKEIINSYFSTFKIINVFPLGFESESSSLARLAGLISSNPSLIVYLNGQRGVICFSQDRLVLLATTFSFSSLEKKGEELLAELKQTANFWQANFGKERKIVNVFLAGQTENELVLKQSIKEYFGVEVKKLALPMILPTTFPQDYLSKLIPLCGLAFLSRPAGGQKREITLIPDTVRQERESFNFRDKVKDVLKITSLVFWGFMALYVGVFSSMFFELEKTKAGLSGWEKVIVTPHQIRLERQAANLNQKLVSLEEVLGRRKEISSLLLDFAANIPAGILITDFTFDTKGKTMEIRGTASSRQEVLALEKYLTQFGQVTIPLSSFEEVTNLNFRAVIKLKS